MDLTDNELRIKVAELRGYKWKLDTEETGYCWHDPYGHFIDRDLFRDDSSTPEGKINSLPHFLTDLNACYEFEETLTDIQFCKYVQIICGHTTRGEKILWTGPDAGRACHATARRRCEAFVKVMDKK